MVIIGWLRRAVILGAKFDECRACHEPGPHLLFRKTHWFTVFWVPVLLLWVSHGVLCPACGDVEGISMLAMRRALRSGRLPLGRSRPAFEAALREHLGGGEPADWTAFGLEPGATDSEIRARWREIAKRLHPDAGGDAAAFVAMSATYQRLLRTTQYQVSTRVDPGELFDPVVPNPKRGFFDFYSTKLWPAAMALLLVSGGISSAMKGTTAPSAAVPPFANGSSVSRPVTPVGASGTAHTCWYSGDELNGCQDDTSSLMLFGTQSGLRTTCWVVEPLGDGEYASCR
jgi:hypothetical protein